MAYEQRDFSGQMFINDKKTQPNHPDRKGRAMVNGVMYWVSGWIKKGNNGNPDWMSLSFTPMEEHGQENQTREERQPSRQQQAPPPRSQPPRQAPQRSLPPSLPPAEDPIPF